MASSFKKKSNRGRGSYPSGTKISLQNNQLLISSGVPSLDSLLGGGVAVGTVILLEEDSYGCYAKTLTRCFLAEGVASGHSLLLATADVEPNDIWKSLPCPVDEVEVDSKEVSPSENDMKIAWRYQNHPKVQSNQPASKFGHFFDFSKTISDGRMSKAIKFEFYAKKYWSDDCGQPLRESRSLLNPLYRSLLKYIQEIIEEHGFSTSNQEFKLMQVCGPSSSSHAYCVLGRLTNNSASNFYCSILRAQNRTILRIVLRSLESPLWSEHTSDYSLPLFLYYLRALMRSSYAVCMVTLPEHLNQDVCLAGRVERLCDTVIRLESFAGSDKETNPTYKEFNGLFHLIRLPRLNSLTCHMPESLDLAFKLRRRKFAIEKLHLPPDISESPSQTDRLSKNTGISCGASLDGSKLDF